MVSWFKDIGITEGGLKLSTLDQAKSIGLASSIKTATELMDTFIREHGIHDNGWTLSLIPQGYGNDYLARAAITYKGFAALPSKEAVYAIAEQDIQGSQLSGKHSYIVHFDHDTLPPVNGFWSLTMYDEKTFNLVENSINRYSIGDRTPEVIYNEDGSLDLYIQHKKPEGHESNWLPAPRADFYMILRLYNPKGSVLDLSWKLPKIERKDYEL